MNAEPSRPAAPAPEAAGGISDAFVDALRDDDPEELYEAAPCAYLSATPDGTIVKANRTFFEWTGFEPTDLVGRRRWQDLLAPGDRIFYETHFAPALRMQGHMREIAVEVVGAGGGRLPVLANAALTLDSSGQPKLVRIVLFDARERRAYEAELVAAKLRAEESEQRAVRLAQTLQTSLLPPALLHIDELDIGAAFRPAGDGSEIGGDFYDAFELTPTSWAFVLGDVCGKGPGAAVLTALARYTIRNEVLRTRSPREVLRAVHDGMLRYHPEQFCTAAMLVVESHREGTVVRTSLGGHHRPLLRTSGGSYRHLGRIGTILGLVLEIDLDEAVERIEPGDTIVLYTDGVPEARRGHEFFDDDRIRAVIDDKVGAGAQQVADALVSAAVDFQSGDARDDIAVLVLQVPPR